MTAAEQTVIRLNIGSGTNPISGWVNVDAHTDADLRADMLCLPYPAESVEEIHCSHALEHLSFADALKALAEFLRVLRPAGVLRVIVPNLDFVAAVWLHGSDRWYARQIMFGNQAHDGEFHRNGWKIQYLVSDIEEAGFAVTGSDIRWTQEYGQESIIVEAVKP